MVKLLEHDLSYIYSWDLALGMPTILLAVLNEKSGRAAGVSIS